MSSPDRVVDIRIAQGEDAPALTRMISLLAEYEQAADLNHATEEIIHRELVDPEGVLEGAIALKGDEYVGMATWFETFSTFVGKRGIYLEDIYVMEDHRHQGIGSALLRFVAKVAVARDCARVEWNTLLWNSSAMEFYESLGARPNDAWTTFRLSGEWLRRQAERCRHQTQS